MGFVHHLRYLHNGRQCLRRPLQTTTLPALPITSRSSSVACFSSTTHRWAASFKTRLGLGGNNWSRMGPAQYQNVVQTTLEQGIRVIEAGQEGGDKALMDALKKVENAEEPLTVTFRIGYHTILPTTTTTTTSAEDAAAPTTTMERFPGDVAVEQHPFLGSNPTMTPLDETDVSLTPPPTPVEGRDDNTNNQMIQILHNITGDFIQNELKESPLVQEYQCNNNNNNPDGSSSSNLRVVALLHNPEAQIMAMAAEYDINQVSIENRQIFLRDRLVESFIALEQAVEDKTISSYGVVSNGLGLPPEHPLALSVDTVLEAAKLAMEKRDTDNNNNNACHLTVIQLPINLMERTGLEIARDLHEKMDTDDQYQIFKDDPPLEIYAMRPLTCYPDRGTGTGHAFRLVDYQLPSGPKALDQEESAGNRGDDDKPIPDEELASKQWSNLMSGPPLIYSIALKKAMSHFDAEFILEEKLKRELTAEERETLDGCKLLQSMLHDLDHGLSDVRSLGAHEQDLYQRIIPLIHDTFEEYDEDTADVLEMFFKSYSLAVRYSIADNTRRLLQEGGDDGKGFKYEDLPDEEKLQDYALKYLLKEDAIDHVIVGATQPDQVVQMVRLSRRFDSESEDGSIA